MNERPRPKPSAAIPFPLSPVAHRGLHRPSRGIVENTPSSVEAAIARGYAIEVDLQSALADHPVVYHDETLDRLNNAIGLVSTRSVAELKAIPYKATTDRIFTFDELLEQVAGRVPLFIEVKTMFTTPMFTTPGTYERRIAESVRRYRGPLALMSFDPVSLAALRRQRLRVPIGLISYRWDDDWMPQLPLSRRLALKRMAAAAELSPDFIAYDINGLPDPVPTAYCRTNGVPLLTWTVKTQSLRRKAEAIADAIIFEGFDA